MGALLQATGSLLATLHLLAFTGPGNTLSSAPGNVSKRDIIPYQQPFRLRLLGSPAPGFLGRGMTTVMVRLQARIDSRARRVG